MPLLAEQKKISAILSSLDEKIETNRKINARLEELAQAIFKSWFIDFEPFGGKKPDDWTECNLEDLLTVRYGKDHKYLADGIFPVYGFYIITFCCDQTMRSIQLVEENFTLV